jgi:hypothetical protein
MVIYVLAGLAILFGLILVLFSAPSKKDSFMEAIRYAEYTGYPRPLGQIASEMGRRSFAAVFFGILLLAIGVAVLLIRLF